MLNLAINKTTTRF